MLIEETESLLEATSQMDRQDVVNTKELYVPSQRPNLARPGSQEESITSYLEEAYETEFMPAIKQFVRIPSLSPPYDENWQKNKALIKQCNHLQSFVMEQELAGCEVIVLKEPGRTPFLIVKVAAFNTDSKENVLMYGHMDKQPFGEGWDTDPCDPVIKNGRLYGRGSGDDGYSLFSAVLAIKSCQ